MHGHTFIFGLADGRVIDGSVGGNSARWLNHSCKPNCEAIEDGRGRVFMETLRNVMPGDELCIAYGLTIDEDHPRIGRRLFLPLWNQAVYRFDADRGERIASASRDAFAVPVLLLLPYRCYFSFNARGTTGPFASNL
jgi:SET domain-containing protein